MTTETRYWRDADSPTAVPPRPSASTPPLPAGSPTANLAGSDAIALFVADRPWLALGAALAIGYLYGQSEDALSSSSNDMLRQLGDEIDVLRDAAIATVMTGAREQVRTMVSTAAESSRPLTSLDLGSLARDIMSGARRSDSTAQAGSFREGSGRSALGYDSPPVAGGYDR